MTEQTLWGTSFCLSTSFPNLKVTAKKTAHVTQAQPRPYTTHAPSFQNIQAPTTSISKWITQSFNIAAQKWTLELHWTHHMPTTWVFVFLPYIGIFIPNRIFSGSGNSAKTGIFKARLMKLQCGTKHLVIGSPVIPEVAALLIPAWHFPEMRIWEEWSHWWEHIKYF